MSKFWFNSCLLFTILLLFGACGTTKPLLIDKHIKVNIPKSSTPLSLQEYPTPKDGYGKYGMVAFRAKTFLYNGMPWGFDEVETHGESLKDSKGFFESSIVRREFKITSSSVVNYGDKKALVINYYRDSTGYFQFESDYSQKYFITAIIQYKYPEQQADAEKLVNMILKDLKVD